MEYQAASAASIADMRHLVQDEQAKLLELVEDFHRRLNNSISDAFFRMSLGPLGGDSMDNSMNSATPNVLPFLPSDMRPVMAPIASVDESSEPSIAEGQDLHLYKEVQDLSLEEVRTKQPILPAMDTQPPDPGLDMDVGVPHILPSDGGLQDLMKSESDNITTGLSEANIGEIISQMTAVRSEASLHKKQVIRSRTLDMFMAERTGGWATFVKGMLDYVAGVLVLLNSLVMLIELEMEGSELGGLLGFREPVTFATSLSVIRVINDSFGIAFFLELLIRICVERTHFPKDFANWFDTALVIAGLADFVLNQSLSQEAHQTTQSIVLLRLLRILKSLRAIRMVRSLRIFRGLRVLVKACQCFLPSLCWAMVLLGLMMAMGALLMGNLLHGYIADDAVDIDDRQWVWYHYGTAYRAGYTLFEVTMAGNWPTNARPVISKVSEGFIVFFVLYVTIVVFAVIRVIGAVFLKDTLDAAQNDAEQLVMDKIALKEKYVEKLEKIFKAIDQDGTGLVSEARLADLLNNPKLAAYFQTLDVDVHEGTALFELLACGDGQVTMDEFINGILRCKGPARAIDQVALQADIRMLDAKISTLVQQLDQMDHTEHRRNGRHMTTKHLRVFRSIDMSAELQRVRAT
mmetsp:Transcript_112013/g.267210  ORF Transcript_112013/g.267210 Transcript_112013/m.267210 type:complete len:632 (+) Transcript_112013:40-1935(+)